LVSTPNLSNLVSTTFLTTALISTTGGLSNIVVTKLIAGTNITLTPANGQGQVTIDAAGGGGGGITTGNLVSTTFGLQTSGFLSSMNLTSTVTGLSNIVVTKLIAGTNITLTPANGQGEVTIDAAGGGGGGITAEQLTSTATRWATYPAVSSIVFANDVSFTRNEIVSPGLTFLALVNEIGVAATTSNIDGIYQARTFYGKSFEIIDQVDLLNPSNTNYSYSIGAGEGYTGTISSLAILDSNYNPGPLYLSSLYFGDDGGTVTGQLTTDATATNLFYNTNQLANLKVGVVVSTLGLSNPQLFSEDIGKYFLFTQSNAGTTVNFPTADSNLNGWNVVIKNMPQSSNSFALNTIASNVLAPGLVATVICDGISFYSL
jgi:hypothetical protein